MRFECYLVGFGSAACAFAIFACAYVLPKLYVELNELNELVVGSVQSFKVKL